MRIAYRKISTNVSFVGNANRFKGNDKSRSGLRPARERPSGSFMHGEDGQHDQNKQKRKEEPPVSDFVDVPQLPTGSIPVPCNYFLLEA